MNPLNGIPYLFWGIAIALPTWYLIHRRWMGAHSSDAALDQHHIPTYIAPSQACKAIERF